MHSASNSSSASCESIFENLLRFHVERSPCCEAEAEVLFEETTRSETLRDAEDCRGVKVGQEEFGDGWEDWPCDFVSKVVAEYLADFNSLDEQVGNNSPQVMLTLSANQRCVMTVLMTVQDWCDPYLTLTATASLPKRSASPLPVSSTVLNKAWHYGDVCKEISDLRQMRFTCCLKGNFFFIYIIGI